MRVKTEIKAVILLLFVTTAYTFAQCPARHIVKKNRASIAPYQYDSYALKEITFDPLNPQVVEIEFTAFAGQQYKLVFSTSDFEEDIKLNIYDKNMRSKKRTRVYDSKNGIEKRWTFEPTKAGTYYIDYEIPPSASGKKKNACTVMLIGFKD
ncbi:MAG: hypothetical protein HYU69_05780 [Bacteroidetes bacterium]|nr:hypothetical protein [Bacteroidota bacterium]